MVAWRQPTHQNADTFGPQIGQSFFILASLSTGFDGFVWLSSRVVLV